MIAIFQNYNGISAVLGLLLFSGSLLIWLSGWFTIVRRFTEELFTPGKDLFDQRASYTGTVQFFRWSAWFMGALLFAPTFVGIDIGLAGVTFLIWRYLSKRAKAALVDQ